MKDKLLQAQHELLTAVTTEMRNYWEVVIDSIIWQMNYQGAQS
jgi:hypothetical protein